MINTFEEAIKKLNTINYPQEYKNNPRSFHWLNNYVYVKTNGIVVERRSEACFSQLRAEKIAGVKVFIHQYQEMSEKEKKIFREWAKFVVEDSLFSRIFHYDGDIDKALKEGFLHNGFVSTLSEIVTAETLLRWGHEYNNLNTWVAFMQEGLSPREAACMAHLCYIKPDHIQLFNAIGGHHGIWEKLNWATIINFCKTKELPPTKIGHNYDKPAAEYANSLVVWSVTSLPKHKKEPNIIELFQTKTIKGLYGERTVLEKDISKIVENFKETFKQLTKNPEKVKEITNA